MNNKILLFIFIFVIAEKIKFSLANNHCSKSAIMNIILEQCIRLRRDTENYLNRQNNFNINSLSEDQNLRRNRRNLRKNSNLKLRIARNLYQISDHEESTKKFMSSNDMDDIFEFISRTRRSPNNKEEIIRNVALCCQDLESCREKKAIITCP
ncbi:hypothetical protein PV327_006814 [Microctonus hyperodae]|uniref:Uncharacterized protein n=1 Tax=Microctonus hyperodae TaxID=165561 RepID=A0AA39KIZ1_MICHY|nr:hypothetical protein PV327_006814 [Microctonus hyperodae]